MMCKLVRKSSSDPRNGDTSSTKFAVSGLPNNGPALLKIESRIRFRTSGNVMHVTRAVH